MIQFIILATGLLLHETAIAIGTDIAPFRRGRKVSTIIGPPNPDPDFDIRLQTFSEQDTEKASGYWDDHRIKSVLALNRDIDVYCDLTPDGKAQKRESKINDSPAFPYIGKLLVQLSGVDGICLASVIQSRSMDIVATAAHCLYDIATNQTATNVVFHPGYEYQNDNLQWFAHTLAFPQAFTKTHDLSPADIGFVKLQPRKTEGKIETYLRSKPQPFIPAGQFDSVTENAFVEIYGQKKVGTYTVLNEPLVMCEEILRKAEIDTRMGELEGCGLPTGSSGGPVYEAITDRRQVGVLIGSTKDKLTGELMSAIIAPFGPIAKKLIQKLGQV